MSTAATLRERRRVESFDVDRFGGIRPQALFGILLNTAWNATRGSVYGYQELSRRGLMWVLVKLHLRVHATPRWGDDIEISTWGKRVERFYALRDFVVSTAGGQKAVSATTVWMVIDKSRGRPQRLDPTTDGFPWQPEREEMETSLDRVPTLEEAPETSRFKVQFSDIDVNQHVNATRYLQWMLDSQPPARLQESEPCEVQLSFVAEALPEDEVAVRSGDGPDGGQLLGITRVGDGRELCRGSLRWRPRTGIGREETTS